MHIYEIYCNLLTGISYSDATPGQSFAYNHLGQLTQITDAAGTRTFACNPYGEPETDSLEANGLAWQVSELYDGLGRPAGYELSAGERRIQQTRLSYDGKGRLSTLTAEGMEGSFTWTYSEQGGLVEQLAYPNGMTRVNTCEDSRDLLSVIDYQRPGSANPPARHEYDYDALGRPTRRRDTWNTAAPKTTRLFTYNSRGELIGDQLRPGGRFGYQYDNIGNRKEAFEFGNTTDYETDELNRYAGIAGNGAAAFVPQYDADGNQTLVKTSTGIWTVTYNAENRPVKFESEDGGTTVECAYDSMGRRFEKKVTVGGTTGFHARYLYRGYLQVAECDLTGETPKLVRSYLWDPSEPQATRVLTMTRWEANGTQIKEHLYYMHDALKNVTSLFGEACGRRALYEYRPYGGLITSEGNMAEENKFRFSSEYMDDELGLVYYNYRHLNPHDGRWISRDPIMEEGGWNLFAFVKNQSNQRIDGMGLNEVIISGGCNTNMGGMNGSSIYFDRFITYFTLNVGQKFNIPTFHDRNWANFITAAEEQIKKRKENLRLGERIEWFVEYDSYRIRAINDKMGSQYYLDQIRKKAKELDVDLKFYKSKKDLAQLVNTIQVYQLDNITGTVTTIFMERSGQDRISRLVYYGHGYAGTLTPRFPFPTYGVPNTEISITSEDIRQGIFQQGSFMQSAVVISCGCNTATPPDKNIPSFAEVWEGFFGSVMYGVKGKTDYTNPKKPQPSGGRVDAKRIPIIIIQQNYLE